MNGTGECVPRCSSHNCELVRLPSGSWDCPISALSDLCDQFSDLYGYAYGPAPAGENGVYHRAATIVAASDSYGLLGSDADTRAFDNFGRLR